MLRLILAYTDPGSGSMVNAAQVWGAVIFTITVVLILLATSHRNKRSSK
jgi:hypothetical protein